MVKNVNDDFPFDRFQVNRANSLAVADKAIIPESASSKKFEKQIEHCFTNDPKSRALNNPQMKSIRRMDGQEIFALVDQALTASRFEASEEHAPWKDAFIPPDLKIAKKMTAEKIKMGLRIHLD